MAENEENKRMVKGAMLVDYVRMIRSRRDIQWEKYLNEKDLEVVNDKIFPTGWYPYETFRKCGIAVFNEIAKGDLNVVRQFGRFSMQNLVEKTYRLLTEGDDLLEALEKFSHINRRFFKFTWLKSEKIGDKSIRISIINVQDEELMEAFCHQIIGYYDYLIGSYGGKDVQVTWKEQTWKGDESVVFELAWE